MWHVLLAERGKTVTFQSKYLAGNMYLAYLEKPILQISITLFLLSLFYAIQMYSKVMREEINLGICGMIFFSRIV